MELEVRFLETERRSVSELGAGIHSRDSLSCITTLCQGQANNAHVASQVVHLSIAAFSCLYSFSWYLPS